MIWSVIRVSSGNFLEMYDFMVFGYYASAIGNAFFPSGNPFVSLMLSLMTFGAGFLMRPLGAIVLGAYTDRHGRRAGLILTLGLMSVGILSIALHAGLRDHRPARAAARAGRPSASGFFGGHGIGRRLGLSCRRSPRRATRASMSAGNRRASKWPSCSRRCVGVVLSSTLCRRSK